VPKQNTLERNILHKSFFKSLPVHWWSKNWNSFWWGV